MSVTGRAGGPTPRTMLEHVIRESDRTYDEWADEFSRLNGYADVSARHLARLARGEREGSGTTPATRRALEAVFGIPARQLLAPYAPSEDALALRASPDMPETEPGHLLRALRTEAEMTLRELATISFLHWTTLNKIEQLDRPMSLASAVALDRALGTGTRLQDAVRSRSQGSASVYTRPRSPVHIGRSPAGTSGEPAETRGNQELASVSAPSTLDRESGAVSSSSDPTHEVRWETLDLIERIQKSDVSPNTLERLEVTVFELCCEYPYRDAGDLTRDARSWLSYIANQIHRPISLRAHKELLVSSGWLALLLGCLEYDQGMRAEAEGTRVSARQLGREAGHNEIVAWSHEMSAWFALTQGRYDNVVSAAEAGQNADRVHSVQVQLLAQEAKALGRQRDTDGVKRALERGGKILSSLPRPDRPEHHFVVDPEKWHFYAMDAYRLAGEDELALEYAREVLAKGTATDGSERAPMRMAEARLTMGVVAARSGGLDEAESEGLGALEYGRRSMPSLMMIARELYGAMRERFPREHATKEFRDRLRSLRG